MFVAYSDKYLFLWVRNAHPNMDLEWRPFKYIFQNSHISEQASPTQMKAFVSNMGSLSAIFFPSVIALLSAFSKKN